MATCACGNKMGWTQVKCNSCGEKERVATLEKMTEVLKTQYPTLAAWGEKYGIDSHFLTEEVLSQLPKDQEYIGYVNGGTSRLFLTPDKLIRFEVAVLSSRVKTFETIPLTTISGFETKPPTPSFPTMWTFKITGSSNVDEFYVTEGDHVKPFISQVNDAIAASRYAGTAKTSGTESQADGVANKIKALAGLHAEGILTDEEFASKKAELLKEL